MKTLSMEEWVSTVENDGLNGIVWPASIHVQQGVTYCLSTGLVPERLVIISEVSQRDSAFGGKEISSGEKSYRFCPLNGENAAVLRQRFSYTAPVSIGRNSDSFGVGDRLGIASTGHLRLFTRTSMIPVLAQQSLRELDLTGRNYSEVIDAATWAVFRSGYTGKWVADGDHLKYAADAVSALKQGCTMITADLSDHIQYAFVDMDEQELLKAYNALDREYRHVIESRYTGEISIADSCTLHFTPVERARTVLVYQEAVDYALQLYRACKEAADDFDFEVSIDETETATTLEAHYFVARELALLGVNYSSLAPRFVGEFQKGIDYIGDLEEFENNFASHAALAGAMGYKISVHSASDKFSAYPAIARKLQGHMHIKTSGTNWLAAIRVIAGIDPGFYRTLHAYAYEIFPVASTYYHVTPDMDAVVDLDGVMDEDLPGVLDNPNDRQVLHVSYGEVLKVPEYREKIYALLTAHITAYWDELEQHIGRHIDLLGKLEPSVLL